MLRAPHATIARERRVHRENMAHQFVVRIEVCDVVKDNKRVEERDARHQQQLCVSRNHETGLNETGCSNSCRSGLPFRWPVCMAYANLAKPKSQGDPTARLT